MFEVFVEVDESVKKDRSKRACLEILQTNATFLLRFNHVQHLHHHNSRVTNEAHSALYPLWSLQYNSASTVGFLDWHHGLSLFVSAFHILFQRIIVVTRQHTLRIL